MIDERELRRLVNNLRHEARELEGELRRIRLWAWLALVLSVSSVVVRCCP